MSASTILFNGRFHTVYRTQSLASAVAIADGTCFLDRKSKG